jgi:hypothetical protein
LLATFDIVASWRRIELEVPHPQLPAPGGSPLISTQFDWLIPYLMVWAAVTIPGLILGWLGLFPKAGQPRWAALVPLYNIYVLVVRVAGLSRLWFVLILVPPVNLIAAILVNVEVSKRYGRSETFGLGLTVFGFVLYPVLGFGCSVYDPQRTPFQETGSTPW